MKKVTEITCLFLDIGGVLLTNGWDQASFGLLNDEGVLHETR